MLPLYSRWPLFQHRPFLEYFYVIWIPLFLIITVYIENINFYKLYIFKEKINNLKKQIKLSIKINFSDLTVVREDSNVTAYNLTI